MRLAIIAIFFLWFIGYLPTQCQAASGTIKYTLALKEGQCKSGSSIFAKVSITNLGKREVWLPKNGICVKANYRIEKSSQFVDQQKATYPSPFPSPVPVSRHGRDNYYPGRVFEVLAEGGTPSKNENDYILLRPGESYSGGPFNLLRGAESFLKPGDWNVWLLEYYASDKIVMPKGFCGWLRSNSVNFSIEK